MFRVPGSENVGKYSEKGITCDVYSGEVADLVMQCVKRERRKKKKKSKKKLSPQLCTGVSQCV